VSNRNAIVILGALGLEDSPYGSVEPVALLARLEERAPDVLYVKETEENNEPGKAHLIDFGITQSQLKRYWDVLREIALEAQRREVLVIWT
jgi:hypothetical protein